MKIIVTGGAGFIGSHLVDELVRQGHKVKVVDNLCIFKKQSDFFYRNPKAEYYKYDIRSPKPLVKAFRGVDIVFHLAALARIQPSMENPGLYEETNSLGTMNVLIAAKKAGARRVIYSSSSSVYGRKNKPPVSEEMFPDPLNPYAATKLSGEYYCKIFSSAFGLETVILRYFNVYGPRQPKIGQYTPVVAKFIRQINNGEPMTIVGDGKMTRSFTYVNDVVGANISAMKSKKIGKGEIINIATGPDSKYSINRLAEMIGKDKITNLIKNKRAVYIPPRLAEILHSRANISKAKKLLGWLPKIKMEEGIEKLRMLEM